MIGKKFGRWTVLKEAVRKNSHYKIFWLCKCVCGNTKVVNGWILRGGDSRSCGCLHSESARRIQKKYQTTHGMRHTRIWRIFQNLKGRCRNKNNSAYKNYGGRGIRCLWNSFEEFYRDMKAGYDDALTIERKDNDGHYYKENCRWATDRDQALNLLTFNGRTQNMKTWAREMGIKNGVLWYRIKSGWPVEMALTLPVRSLSR